MILNKFDDLFLVWKPSMIASTAWKKENLIDLIDSGDTVFFDMIDKDEIYEQFAMLPESFSALLKASFAVSYNSYHQVAGSDFFAQQKEQFSREEEFWLLNRLDLATQWWVYFAGNKPVYTHWADRQAEKRIVKTYYAVVHWAIEEYFTYGVEGKVWLTLTDAEIIVDRPIMHHKDDATKMLAIVDDAQKKKWRWKLQSAVSTITPCSYDQEADISLIRVTMHAWARHQIRVHCASLWHPIVWDNHYGDSQESTWSKAGSTVWSKTWSTLSQAAWSKLWDAVWLCLWSMSVEWSE